VTNESYSQATSGPGLATPSGVNAPRRTAVVNTSYTRGGSAAEACQDTRKFVRDSDPHPATWNGSRGVTGRLTS